MTIKSQISGVLSRLITHPKRRSLGRALAEARQAVSRGPRRIDYFHRTDDPYCQLLVQVIPLMMERFAVEIVPHVVHNIEADVLPEPGLMDMHSVRDTSDLAKLYRLDWPQQPVRCDGDAALRVDCHLALLAEDRPADFWTQAQALGAQFWQGIPPAVPAPHQAGLRTIGANERRLARLGHYYSGTLHYGGEWYGGLDRLSYLEERWNDLGIGDGKVFFDRGFRDLTAPLEGHSGSGEILELFFSVRSPFSYVGFFQARKLALALDRPLALRPILPMVMRGLPVPRAKRLYILTDAKREAERAGLPFGAIADPLGAGVERCYAVAWWVLETLGPAMLDRFFESALKGIASEAIDVATDPGMRRVTQRVGLDWPRVQEAMRSDAWKPWVDGNRDEMRRHGYWGVPCLKYGRTVVWGQDRFWKIRKVVEAEMR